MWSTGLVRSVKVIILGIPIFRIFILSFKLQALSPILLFFIFSPLQFEDQICREEHYLHLLWYVHTN